MRCHPIVAAALLTFATTGEAFLTGTLVGTETMEGETPTRFFMSGQCSENQDILRCHFNQVAIFKSDARCKLLASGWSEDFKRVRRTSTEAVWATTRGPEGLLGALTTTTLTVHIGNLSRTTGGGVGGPLSPSDDWEYVSRVTFSDPKNPFDPRAKPMKPVTSRAVPSWAPGAVTRAECLPDEIVIVPESP